MKLTVSRTFSFYLKKDDTLGVRDLLRDAEDLFPANSKEKQLAGDIGFELADIKEKAHSIHLIGDEGQTFLTIMKKLTAAKCGEQYKDLRDEMTTLLSVAIEKKTNPVEPQTVTA